MKLIVSYMDGSSEIISMDEYKKRFGKDIDLSIEIIADTKW